MGRPIVFLSDYGLEDEFVGICHGVVARLAPGTPVIDLTHAIPPQDVLRGAVLLAQAVPYLPPDAVLLAVVDPGVGTDRRPVAVELHGSDHLMVGPDNGVLSLAWREAGGPRRAVEIRSPDVVLQPISATFHGRDVFAPAAARLANGLPLEALGPPVAPRSLRAVAMPPVGVEPGAISCEVLGVDRFGNLQLSARQRDLAAAGLADAPWLEVVSGETAAVARAAKTFGEVAEGELGVILDSAGWVAVVINRGSAAEALGLVAGSPVTIQGRGDGA